MNAKHVIVGRKPEPEEKVYKWEMEINKPSGSLVLYCNSKIIFVAYTSGSYAVFNYTLSNMGLEHETRA